MNQRLEQLKQFRLESPTDPFIIYAIASEYIKLGDLQMALNEFENLVLEHPDYLGTYYHLGKLLEQLVMVDRAMETYQQGMLIAQKTNNRHAFGELNGALQLLKMQQDDEED